MSSSGPLVRRGGQHITPTRGFWLSALGVVLLFGSVGLVSCQALFSL